jgi:Na+/H+ antiporter NhaA
VVAPAFDYLLNFQGSLIENETQTLEQLVGHGAAFVIIPVFVLANAGINFASADLAAARRLIVGVVAGSFSASSPGSCARPQRRAPALTALRT